MTVRPLFSHLPKNRNISSVSSTVRIEFWPSTRGRAKITQSLAAPSTWWERTVETYHPPLEWPPQFHHWREEMRSTYCNHTTFMWWMEGEERVGVTVCPSDQFTQCQIVWQINRTKTPVSQATRNHSPHHIMDRQPQRPSYATTFLHSDARKGGGEWKQ